ncbi:MAG: hypothetical protein K8T25_23735 [Planctomycetia bacterium]|nr:hypothetical protein [Planctomycetia bacterium]
MIKIVHGIVHGKTIKLDSETGLEDGRKVEVILRSNELPGPPPGWKPGSNETAAGMMASSWTEEDDRILDEIHLQRSKNSRREITE